MLICQIFLLFHLFEELLFHIRLWITSESTNYHCNNNKNNITRKNTRNSIVFHGKYWFLRWHGFFFLLHFVEWKMIFSHEFRQHGIRARHQLVGFDFRGKSFSFPAFACFSLCFRISLLLDSMYYVYKCFPLTSPSKYWEKKINEKNTVSIIFFKKKKVLSRRYVKTGSNTDNEFIFFIDRRGTKSRRLSRESCIVPTYFNPILRSIFDHTLKIRFLHSDHYLLNWTELLQKRK